MPTPWSPLSFLYRAGPRSGRAAAALAVLLLLAPGPAAIAQEFEAETAAEQPQEAPEAAPPQDAAPQDLGPVTTVHELAVGDATLRYRATAEFLQLVDEAGEPTGRLFLVSYAREAEEADEGPRPVTFALNGGPGAASAFLHIGGLGPYVLETTPEGVPASTPPRMIANPDTWLPFTDLVFLDPIGTGLSRPAPGREDADRRFFSVDGDLNALIAAIRLWLDQNQRWGDPVYIVGESYGGFRAAAFTDRMEQQGGVVLSGVVLVAPVIDYALVRGDAVHPMAWVSVLPAMVASAREHGLIEGDAPSREEVEAFALGDYAEALIRPERLAELVPTLARWTGLPESLVRQRRGRIGAGEFRRVLLAGQDAVASLYDATVTMPDPRPTSPFAVADPILDAIKAPLTTAFLAYLRRDLEWPTTRGYQLLNAEVNRRWTYGPEGRQGYVSAVGDLQNGLALNPGLRVLIVHGETDLVTPYFASEWLVSQIRSFVPARADAIETVVVPGGHMMYLQPDSRRLLTEAAERLIGAAPNGPEWRKPAEGG